MQDRVELIHRLRAFTVALLSIAMIVLTACQPVQPQTVEGETGAGANAAAIPEAVIEVDDTQFTIPADFPGGIVRVTVQNNSSKDLDIGFARVREGSSVDEIEALNADFEANMIPLMEMVSFMVSFNPVAAGAAKTAIVDFRTGQFIMDATEHSEEAPPPGQAHIYGVFKAEKLVGTIEPQADVKVEMQDFAYVMPDEIKAGKLLWEYDNTGTQWHMQVLAKASPNATTNEVMAALMAAIEGTESSGPLPFEDVADVGIPPFGEGERTWMEFSLDPGTYVAVCPLPDLAAIKSGAEPMSHMAKGMHHILTVK